MPEFHVVSEYSPAGDQPQAIEKLAEGVAAGLDEQTLAQTLEVIREALAGKAALFVSHRPQELGIPTLRLA